jgi:hypothetical protein
MMKLARNWHFCRGNVCGDAVVATNTGVTITEGIDGFNGILCWPNQESLLEGLLKLIDSPGERLQMQKRGWGDISKSIRYAAMAGKMERRY